VHEENVLTLPTFVAETLEGKPCSCRAKQNINGWRYELPQCNGRFWETWTQNVELGSFRQHKQ